MKKILALSVISSALMMPVLASAATTADLKLIGTITPAACVPNFTGGATIDYGNIPASTLNATAQTLLPEKTTKFSVVCDSPIKFAFTITDDRSSTTVSSLDTISGYPANAKFGLGSATNGAKIGAYSLQISNEVVDTGTTRRLGSKDGGATWYYYLGGMSTGDLFGFGDSATATVASAHKSVAMDVRVVAAIDKTSNLPITSEIKIDGLTTFEVKYL